MKRHRSCLAAAAALLLLAAAVPLAAHVPPTQPLDSPAVNARAEALLRQLSTTEKIYLLSGYDFMFTHPIPAHGIPALKMSDASVGVRVWGPSTAYPASAALAATWDPALAYREGHSLGRDARARGVNFVLGPGMDIVREPQNGRNFEYLGEDPELASRMAVAWIRGLQDEGVAAVAKHYAGNEQETHRGTINSVISRRALEEIYLAPFRAAVEQGHVMAVMAAYNKVNGLYSSANPYLLTTMLRRQWHFRGVAMSDWGGTHSTLPSLLAGLDLEMPTNQYYNARAIYPLLGSGELTMANINRHVLRLLRVMVAMRFLDRAQKIASIPLIDPTSAATAEQVESEAVVLLKNRDAILPLRAAGLHSIVVVGPDATPAVTGGGGSSFTTPNIAPVSLLAAVRQAAGPGVRVTYFSYPLPLRPPHMWPPPKANSFGPLPPLPEAQQAAIRRASVVIAAVGPRESEGVDRPFRMPAHQDQYLRQVAALNSRTVVVIYAGAGVAMSAWIHQVAGLLYAWYPGENGNTAVAKILFGRLDPSGHLPDTFAQHWSDAPAFGHYPGHDGAVHFAEGIDVGYRWFDSKHIAPLFPFGFGLSYTAFRLSGLRVASSGQGRHRVITASVRVSNTGRRAGAEVVQLYVRPAPAPVPRTFQQLRAFARVALAPGQSRRVALHLHWNDFAYYDTPAHAWRVPAGDYQLAVGDSSRHILQTAAVHWNPVERVQAGMVAAAANVPPVQVAGAWNIVTQVMGTSYPSTCSFQQNGDVLSGQCSTPSGERPIQGRVRGAVVSWSTHVAQGGMKMTVAYSGQFTAPHQRRFQGATTVLPMGISGTFTAVRQ
ncbi:MAG: beta-glucosidase family protein [Terriglobales bacterium]